MFINLISFRYKKTTTLQNICMLVCTLFNMKMKIRDLFFISVYPGVGWIFLEPPKHFRDTLKLTGRVSWHHLLTFIIKSILLYSTRFLYVFFTCWVWLHPVSFSKHRLTNNFSVVFRRKRKMVKYSFPYEKLHSQDDNVKPYHFPCGFTYKHLARLVKNWKQKFMWKDMNWIVYKIPHSPYN